MRLLDLVEQDQAERAFTDRVGQFAARIIANIAGRRPDRALVSMFRRKLAHVESDILDQAGWHTANDLDLPDNISLLFLPPYSPELNLPKALVETTKPASYMSLMAGAAS